MCCFELLCYSFFVSKRRKELEMKKTMAVLSVSAFETEYCIYCDRVLYVRALFCLAAVTWMTLSV